MIEVRDELSVAELDAKLHDRKGFDCGVEALNRYIRTLAGQHRAKGIATTFVLTATDAPQRILGYYSLSAASLAFERLTEAERKGLPAYPIPSVRIGRLAVALHARGKQFGELLLQSAIKRILAVRHTLGVHAVMVEAKDSNVQAFYEKYGFRICYPPERQLYLCLPSE